MYLFKVETDQGSRRICLTLQHIDNITPRGSGIIEGEPDTLDFMMDKADNQSALFLESDHAFLELHKIEWGERCNGDFPAEKVQHFTFVGERFITKDIVSVNEKELFFMRKSTKVVSEPGAALEMKTMEMPPRIQKRISDALQGVPSNWISRFLRGT